nr:hypothetical protein [Bacteroidota bacterium]
MASWYNWGFPAYPYPDSVRNQYNENLGVINYPDSIGKAAIFNHLVLILEEKGCMLTCPIIQIIVWGD